MKKRSKWTKEEEEFLQEKWGSMNVNTISKALNRSVNAIMIKKSRLGLGSFLESGDYMTFNALVKALGHSRTGSDYKVTSWINNRNCPVYTKTVRSRKIKVIRLNDFWEWAEQNKSFLDFSKFEKGAIGIEPDWVDRKRREDTNRRLNFKTSKWTQDEEEYLKFLLNEYKYTYDELSEKLRRTPGGIQARIHELNLKQRAVKADDKRLWTDEEDKKLMKSIKLGLNYETIAKEIGRSTYAVRGRCYRKFGTENIDKIANKVDGYARIF